MMSSEAFRSSHKVVFIVFSLALLCKPFWKNRVQRTKRQGIDSLSLHTAISLNSSGYAVLVNCAKTAAA